jgi:hypothetical protein
MLPCTEVLVVGLISFRERVDPKSLEWWWWRFRSVRFRLLFDYPRHGPCLPFMASKRRARFTFVVKWWKRGEWKKKAKRVASNVAVLLLIRREQFPCSVKSCEALIFWPLCLLVWRAGAMPWPVCPCVTKVGDLGGIAASPLLLWRYGCRRGRMIGVMSSQSVVLVPLLTVHGHVHHVDGANTVLGVPVAPRLAWGLHVPLGRGGECIVGVGHLWWRRRGSGEAKRRRPRRLSCVRPLRKVRAR